MALWQAGVMNSMDDAVLGEPESYGIDFELLSSVTEMDDHRNCCSRVSSPTDWETKKWLS